MNRRLRSLAMPLAIVAFAVSSLASVRAQFVPSIPLRSYCDAAITSVSPVLHQSGVWRYALGSERSGSLSAELMFQASTGWYTIRATDVRIRDNTATYRANGASFTREVNSSSAQFFALPPGAGEVLGAWVAAAGRSGSAQLSPCPTIPWVKGFGVMSQPKPTHRKVRKGIAAMPDLALAIPQARATASPVDAHCTLFYQSARVLESASLHYPLGNHLRHEVDAEVLIEIGRHNNIVGAVMYVPTGMGAFDRGALDAAKRTHFRSARALCKTVPSLYLYIARFAPSPGL